METGGNNSRDDEISNASSRKEKNSIHRHEPEQIQTLEAFFQECPNPDKNQRYELGVELGLDPKQIKFWFQNKRSKTKTQIGRVDNSALRAKSEEIQCENYVIKEALKNVLCSSCGGPPSGEEECQRSLHELRMENAHLREEHEKVLNLLAKYIGMPHEDSMPRIGSTAGMKPPTFSIPDISAAPEPAIDPNSWTSDDHLGTPHKTEPLSEMEKAIMAETAANATEEFIRLVRMNEPVWVKSSMFQRNYDSCERTFPGPPHFKNPNTRTETSKHLGTAAMNGLQLVDLMLDAARWANFFSTIVTKAETIHVVEAGMPENRNGCILLMHQQMHILSPLVPLRKFYILRHCQQLDLGLWIIVDVSYDWSKLDEEEDPSTTSAWKLPSGCMIHDLANGSCKVTWVEHVEVDDRTQTHRLYRELICGTTTPAYGAERWMVTLQRMCEKLAFATMNNPPSEDLVGVITTVQGRRRLIKLSNRMVKNFSGILSMSRKIDFPQLSEVKTPGLTVSVRNASDSGQPIGTVVSAATSLWLPLPYEAVFHFFRDVSIRAKWDVLCNGKPVHEIANVTNGAHPGNCLKILRPSEQTDQTGMVMIQESYIDSLGSMVIYSPLDKACMNYAIHGGDVRMIPILPSGFIISGDGRPKIGAGGASTSSACGDPGGSGSLLTVAFQILVSGPGSPGDLIMTSVASIHTLISSTVEKIKASLNYSNVD